MSVTGRLADLDLTLPPVATPLAAYTPAVRHGDTVVTSGQLPSVDGEPIAVGKVGAEVTPEQASEAARIACLNALAAAAGPAGGVDNIVRVLKVIVYVASAPDFTGQPAVANGASNLLTEIFDDAGVHARSAVGVAVLPLDVPVEVELTVQVA